MAIECGVITALLLIIAIVFFRTKRPKWGWATLPIMLVPITDFVAEIMLKRVFRLELSLYWGVLALVIAVAASCAWIGFMAVSFAHKGTKISYIGIANAFNVLLAAILINDMMNNQ